MDQEIEKDVKNLKCRDGGAVHLEHRQPRDVTGTVQRDPYTV